MFLKDLEFNVSFYFWSRPWLSDSRVPRLPPCKNTRVYEGFQGSPRGSTPRAACPPGGTPIPETSELFVFPWVLKVLSSMLPFISGVLFRRTRICSLFHCLCKIFAGARPACGFAGPQFAIVSYSHDKLFVSRSFERSEIQLLFGNVF